MSTPPTLSSWHSSHFILLQLYNTKCLLKSPSESRKTSTSGLQKSCPGSSSSYSSHKFRLGQDKFPDSEKIWRSTADDRALYALSVSDEILATLAPFSDVERLLSSVIHLSRSFFLPKAFLNSATSGFQTSKVSQGARRSRPNQTVDKECFCMTGNVGSIVMEETNFLVSMPRVRFWTILYSYLLARILFSLVCPLLMYWNALFILRNVACMSIFLELQ